MAEQPIGDVNLIVEQGHSISLIVEPAKIITIELFLSKEKINGTFKPPAFKIVDMKN